MKEIICSLISGVLFYLFSSLRASLDESKEIYWGRQKLWFCLAEDRHAAMISHWPHALQNMYIMSVPSNVSVHCLTHRLNVPSDAEVGWNAEFGFPTPG